jgi:SHS2 domain-containing protein
VVTRARDAETFGREIDHTADVGLEIDAPTLAILFERAGLAMLGLMVDLAGVAPREVLPLSVEADGHAELLHDFLTALLVACTARGFVASELGVDAIDDRMVRATARGEPLDADRHDVHGEIKAVTYHELSVRRVAEGWRARVIFDV